MRSNQQGCNLNRSVKEDLIKKGDISAMHILKEKYLIWEKKMCKDLRLENDWYVGETECGGENY